MSARENKEVEFIQTPTPANNFLILDKRISEDDRLSLAARAILVYLLGKPSKWRVIIENLVNMTSRARRKSGKHVIYESLNELVELGYVSRRKQSSGEMAYFVHGEPIKPRDFVPNHADEPDSENRKQGSEGEGEPDSKKPNLENPNLENRTLVSTDTSASIDGEQALNSAAPAGSPQADLLGDAPPSKPSKQAVTKSKASSATKKETKQQELDAMGYLAAEGVEVQVARDWLKVREKKGGINTLTAFKRIARDAEKVGITFAEAVTYSAEKGWVGFYIDSYLKDAQVVQTHAQPQRGGFMTLQERNRAISEANMRAALADDGVPLAGNDPYTIEMER